MKNSHSVLIWCRDRREAAVEDIQDFRSGTRPLHEMRGTEQVDVVPEWIDRLKLEIEALDRLIAADGEPYATR
jgi:hypothetical protein